MFVSFRPINSCCRSSLNANLFHVHHFMHVPCKVTHVEQTWACFLVLGEKECSSRSSSGSLSAIVVPRRQGESSLAAAPKWEKRRHHQYTNINVFNSAKSFKIFQPFPPLLLSFFLDDSLRVCLFTGTLHRHFWDRSLLDNVLHNFIRDI